MAAEKMIAVDFWLGDMRVADAQFSQTATVLEHEIVLWNPSGVEHQYSATTPYMNATTLDQNGSVRFLMDVARRGREFMEFLALGRSLVILVPPPATLYVATGERRNDGTPGKPQMKTIVRPFDLSELLPGKPKLRAGRGESFQQKSGPPFSDFWKAQKEHFSYDAIIDEHPGAPLLTIKGTSHVVGAYAQVGGGHVWYLPRIDGLRENEGVHTSFVDSIVQLVADTTGDAEAAPQWASRFLLPGEADATRALTEAEASVDRALVKRDAEQSALLDVQRSKALVTATGKQLEKAVTDAFEALGAEVEEGAAGRTDRIVKWRGRVAVVEVKGLSKSAAEKDAAQLEKWVISYIEDHDQRPKAILAANAWRNDPLDERTRPVFPDQMVPYAQGREHCLVSTTQLLAATYAEDPAVFLDAVFATNGPLDGFAWQDAVSVVEPGE
jgi:hypothetical protein